MKNYSTMDDGAINMLVGESIGLTSYYLNHDRSVQLRNEKGHIKGTKNYCNNPADAWPIIAENKISMCCYERDNPGMKMETWWEADVFTDFITRDENPLRAAMIVYLMMKDAEKCDG